MSIVVASRYHLSVNSTLFPLVQLHTLWFDLEHYQCHMFNFVAERRFWCMVYHPGSGHFYIARKFILQPSSGSAGFHANPDGPRSLHWDFPPCTGSSTAKRSPSIATISRNYKPCRHGGTNGKCLPAAAAARTT